MSDRPPFEEPQNDEIRINLVALPSFVVFARDYVRWALTGWGYRREIIEDSMVVMSELVTNAVNAAHGHRIRIRIAVHEGAPLLECWDPASEAPRSACAPLYSENGRGLLIIAAYAKDTGVRPAAAGGGKIVWALMPT